jgi:prepilin-type processing-associated H-X9-DG protein
MANYFLSYLNSDPSNAYYRWEKLERQTSKIYLMADAYGTGAATIKSWDTTATPNYHRHTKGFNVVFCDGHAEYHKGSAPYQGRTTGFAAPWIKP